MILFSQTQALVLVVLAFVAGGAVIGTSVWFILKNIQERKKRRPTPFVQSILTRYTDLMYDEKYARMSDREFIKIIRDTAFIMLWLSVEASTRLTRKVEKAEEKKT